MSIVKDLTGGRSAALPQGDYRAAHLSGLTQEEDGKAAPPVRTLITNQTIPRVSRPALRYFGGAWLRAAWINSFFPEAMQPGHRAYLEPCAGAASVLFHKYPCKLETVNDIDGRVVNFFRVASDRQQELLRALQWTPWAEDEYRLCLEPSDDVLEDARRFLFICWASVRGGPHLSQGDFRWQRRMARLPV